MTYRVPYAQASWGDYERFAVAAALQDGERLVSGANIADFEHRVADLLGMAEGVMVNSGSSANLLALLALKQKHNIPDGSAVLTPILTGGWIIGPILQAGLVPVFCDVEPQAYVASIAEIGKRVDQVWPSMVLYPLLLGNGANLFHLRDMLNGRPLIVDSCDTLNPDLRAGLHKVADAVTTSFYASHMITAAGGGGMVAFKDPDLATKARVLSQWGRQSVEFGDSDDVERRFAYELDGIPFDAKFIFGVEGYNLQPTEVQAAFGLAQLDWLGERVALRRQRFNELRTFIAGTKWLAPPVQLSPLQPVWLAFPILLKPGAPFTRMDLARHLEANGIQTRPVMGGNITRQPAFKYLADRRTYPVADDVMRNGLLVGCHESLTDDQMSHLTTTIAEFGA